MKVAKQNPTIRIPQEPEFEREVLGCLLTQNSRYVEAVRTVSAILKPESFSTPQLGRIFAAIVEIAESGQTFTPATLYGMVKDHVRDQGDLQDLADAGGGPDADDATLEQISRIVANAYAKRQVLKVGEWLTSYPGLCDTEFKASTLIDDLKEKLDAIETRSTSAPVTLDLTTITPQPVRWIWPDRIPRRKLTVVGGPGGLGKSWLTLDICARLSAGIPWPDRPNETNPVAGSLVVSFEDDADDIVPRLKSSGADLSRVRLLNMAERSFDLSQLRLIDDALDQTPDPGLIVIDPLSPAFTKGTDFHHDSDVRRDLQGLVQLAERRNVAVLLVCHTNKSTMPGERAISKLLGSVAIGNCARSVAMLYEDEKEHNRRKLLWAKSNLCRQPDGLAYAIAHNAGTETVQLTWESGPVCETADEAARPVKARTPRDVAVEFLRDRLAAGPAPGGEVKADAKSERIAPRTLARAKRHLQIVSKDGLWSLSDGGNK